MSIPNMFDIGSLLTPMGLVVELAGSWLESAHSSTDSNADPAKVKLVFYTY